MKSIESAPASIPAASAVTFAPALEPLSVGTLNRSCASEPSPACCASGSAGTKVRRRHEIRIIEHSGHRGRSVLELHLRDAFRIRGKVT